MIESIEFHVSGQKNTLFYDRESYLTYLEKKKIEYIGLHYAIKQWFVEGKKVESEYKVGMPTFNWDGIVFLENEQKNLIICNPDASIRFKVPIPQKLIQREEYDKHFELSEWKSKEIDKDYYIMQYERFDDYFEYNGKHYLTVLVGKYNENENFDAYLQIRYLDCEAGEFLPFIKTIIQRVPNQYDYFEKTINL